MQGSNHTPCCCSPLLLARCLPRCGLPLHFKPTQPLTRPTAQPPNRPTTRPTCRQRQLFAGDVTISPQEGRGILALQGPAAPAVLARLTDGVDFSAWPFMACRTLAVAGAQCLVSRSGYTGEDGFEIACAGADADALARRILAEEEVKPVGLGARDSLRLESGLCLYGNDLDDSTTPVEAGLLWTIGKRRRAEANFVGADVICAQIQDKKLVTRKRVGFTAKGAPVRAGDELFDMDGNVVGNVTSGVFGPTVKKPVGMAYVQKKFFKSGTELQVKQRGKFRPVTVSKMPFTPANFFRGE